MSEQLQLFEGYQTVPKTWMPVQIIDYAEAEYTLGREEAPYVNVDFTKLASIPDLRQAFAEGAPILLTGSDGTYNYFYALEDLDYNGWLQNPSIARPDFVFYEGPIFGQPLEADAALEYAKNEFSTDRYNHWALLVEPGGNFDGTDTYNFGWQGDPLLLA